jgi:hypothetical protein
MLRLREHARRNPDFVEALRAIWEPARQVSDAVRETSNKLSEQLKVVSSVSTPLQGVMRTICAEYRAQLAAVWADIRQGQEAEYARLIDDIRRAEAEADREWASQFPCPRPKTAEDWQRLAVRAGLSADLALKGEWTPADIMPIVEGYFQRLQDRRQPDSADGDVGSVTGAPRPPAADDGSPFYKPSYFKKYNIGDELLRRNATGGRKYAPGKVRRINKQPSRDKRKFYWYSEPDARRCWPHRFADPDTSC